MTDFELKTMQQKQLEMLLEIDRLCKKHKLKFYLAYGSLIGAVRDKGFIPWDDDVDIFMPQADYEKFCEICKTDLDEKFFLQNPYTDPEYLFYTPKLRYNNTCAVEPKFKDMNMHHGIYIDIFPVYDMPKSRLLKKLQMYLQQIQTLYLRKRKPVRLHKLIIYRLTSILCINEWALKLFNRLMKKVKLDENHVCDLVSIGYYFNTVFDKAWFGEPLYIDFEGHKMPVPEKYHDMLTAYYGDYMTPPPENERDTGHDFFCISFEKNYNELKESLKDE